MILKASQRSNAAELGRHLLKAENEHVTIHQIRGFVADDVIGAFKEAQAIASGTRCKQFLFSVSFNPPESANPSNAVFEDAADRVERANGLSGQPRVMVFHEKDGRRHAHCVWSRINADTMKAVQLSHFKLKLRDIGKALYLENGWKLPEGFVHSAARDPRNYSLSEWQQAKRLGIDPGQFKAMVQECWAASDNARAFTRSLAERGLLLARGDQRGFVVVDHQGEVHSLTRALDKNVRTVEARLGKREALQSVEAAKRLLGERMTPTLKRHIAESRDKFQARSEHLGHRKAEMGATHRTARRDLAEVHETERTDEARARAKRLPTGVKALWSWVTGDYRRILAQNKHEARDAELRREAAREGLVTAQREERRTLQDQIRDLRRDQASLLRDLRRDVGRYLGLSRPEPSRALGNPLSLKLSR